MCFINNKATKETCAFGLAWKKSTETRLCPFPARVLTYPLATSAYAHIYTNAISGFTKGRQYVRTRPFRPGHCLYGSSSYQLGEHIRGGGGTASAPVSKSHIRPGRADLWGLSKEIRSSRSAAGGARFRNWRCETNLMGFSPGRCSLLLETPEPSCRLRRAWDLCSVSGCPGCHAAVALPALVVNFSMRPWPVKLRNTTRTILSQHKLQRFLL